MYADMYVYVCKLTVSHRASHAVFCYTSQLKNRKKCEEIICFKRRWQETKIQPDLTSFDLSQNMFHIYIQVAWACVDYGIITNWVPWIDSDQEKHLHQASIYIEYFVEMIKSTLLWKLFESVKG